MNIYLGANSLTTSGGGTNKIILIITEDENLLGLTLNITGTSGTVYYNGLIAQEIYIEVPIGETLTTNEINGATKSLTVTEAGSRTWVLSHVKNDNPELVIISLGCVYPEGLIGAEITISYDDIEEVYYWNMSNICTYIPGNTNYTITVTRSSITKLTKSFNSTPDTTRNVYFYFKYKYSGVGMATVKGDIIPLSDYNSGKHGLSVGIAISNRFIIKRTVITDIVSNYWLYNTSTNISTIPDSTASSSNHDGVAFTKAISDVGVGAARTCYNNSILFGGRTLLGYLGTIYDWNLFINNYNAFKDFLSTALAEDTTYLFWTSNEASISNAAYLEYKVGSSGSVKSSSKRDSRMICVFYKI